LGLKFRLIMPQVSEAPPEPARLAAVRRTALLDTPPEEAFDRLTRLAARLLGTPVALISLVDEERQFFKSATGLPEPWATARATPLSYSFCRHVVEAGSRLVVEDARRDPLVRTNPAVRELGWVAYAGVPLIDRDGNVLGALSVIDSAPRRWSERDLSLLTDLAAWAVSEIELRIRSTSRPTLAPALTVSPPPLFEETGVPMAFVSEAGRFLGANLAFEHLIGASPGALVGRRAEDLIHPADREAEREALRLLLAGECGSYSAERRVLTDSGEPVWVQATLTRATDRDGTGERFILSLQDLTERKSIEAGIREREERARLVIEASRGIVLDWDFLTDRMAWSNGLDGIFGYALSDFGGAAGWWYERIHPDDRERVVGEIHGVVARGENLWTSEHRFRRADGGWAHIEARASIVRDDAGDAVRMVGSFVDVTERKRAELVGRCQSAILKEIAGGLDLDDVLGRIVAFAESLGGGTAVVHLASEEGCLTLATAGQQLPDSFKQSLERISLDIDGGPWGSAAARRETVIVRDIGADERWGRWRESVLADDLHSAWISPLLGSGGALLGTLAIFHREPYAPDADDARLLRIATDLAQIAVEREHNVAALRRSEEELRQAQKMEAVGQLAGGIAHDFNNLLTGILSFSDLVLQEVRAGDPIRSDIEQIRHAGQRAAALTRQLLAFSRRQILQPKVLSLNSILDELTGMLRRLLGSGITLEVAPDPGLWYVMADPGQIEQVLANLIMNARDATSRGGRVTITTANCRVSPEGPERAGGVRPGTYATLAVADTGVGMDIATQARIFEPFFTTKETGAGPGLGLSSVYGIVEQSGGHITVESAPGRGSTFTIYLPRHNETNIAHTGSVDRRSLPVGSETILLVEDETSVRTSARRLLERHGYTVVEARHGVEALQLAEEPGRSFDLVVTDVVMPEMGGRELVERLRARQPSLKVLFMSGYTERAISADGTMPAGTAFVEKPFTVDQLIRRLRKVLDD
jgi:two-component system, cell cycle sensor histidine kinase and response regulator CckA